ncbi:MAG: hypothetical protein KF865_03970 [Bdellovibrionaceae bacterium]|nr:hypothetical protein [Pseudobdellovibrionaceae bacterium]
MKNGYDQFFKNARKASHGGKPPARPTSSFALNGSPRFELTAEQLEEHLKRKAGARPPRRRKKSFPFGLVLCSALGVALAGWGMLNAESVEAFVKRVEVNFLGEASAADAAPAPKAAPAEAPAAAKAPEAAPVDLNHLTKLNDRKKELDAREEEIGRQEVELARMKEDLESRLKELEGMRAKISEILADRVKVDDQKVETLVQMYSNMKPPQAAKVFESMDEDLAVEILSRMKKKSAADIMNLLPAAKAQVFSEKYAGYKRAPASGK